ncbi:hypothetical protein MYE70_13440 [Marinobacter alexandrii]|nr:hypothetical protein [Marinobacter alexandrii]
MGKNFGVRRVATGCDLGPSRPIMVQACSSAAKALGVEADNYRVLPTSALALKTMANGIPATMVTGGHTPVDRNGIKFYRPEGEITKVDEVAIMVADGPLPGIVGVSASVGHAASDFMKTLRTERFFDKPMSGWKVGLYQSSAVGRDLWQKSAPWVVDCRSSPMAKAGQPPHRARMYHARTLRQALPGTACGGASVVGSPPGFGEGDGCG